MNQKRILAIDPGDKRIGIAISDPTASLAKPLQVLFHKSRDVDAHKIINLAKQNNVILIIIGQATDIDGKPNFSGRKAARLAGAIKAKTEIEIKLWDESFTTKDAQKDLKKMGIPRKHRKGHLDDHAAAHLLQSYLDSEDNQQA